MLKIIHFGAMGHLKKKLLMAQVLIYFFLSKLATPIDNMNLLHNLYKKKIWLLVGNYIWRNFERFFLIWNLPMQQITEDFLLFTAAKKKAEFLLYALK